MDLTFYDKELVVENRLNNTVWRYIASNCNNFKILNYLNVGCFRGLQKAAVNVALYRGLAHFRFMQVEMVILNITPVIEDGTVRVRWRVVGVGILRYLYAMMLRSKFASLEDSIRANAKYVLNFMSDVRIFKTWEAQGYSNFKACPVSPSPNSVRIYNRTCTI
jgi:hypothetical protein